MRRTLPPGWTVERAWLARGFIEAEQAYLECKKRAEQTFVPSAPARRPVTAEDPDALDEGGKVKSPPRFVVEDVGEEARRQERDEKVQQSCQRELTAVEAAYLAVNLRRGQR